MIFLDPDDKSLPLWASKQSLTGSRTRKAPPDTHVCLYMILLRKTSLHSSAKQQQQSYTSLCQHTAVQQSETQDWPESSTEGIIWLIQLFNTAMLAPSHWQISTTVNLHAQFVASFATCDSVPTLASRRVWHFIIAKLRNGKVLFSVFFFFFFKSFLKRSQEAATRWSMSKPQKNAL